ncbi:alpha/beta fold hydrolase [Cohnella caldifontis]|uniref:alpha/beta fold hydrolase n=1 Tax=Cohnella caldifontis TaxID=3027471 RepID=UPI0023EC1092|nr:alpha/beta hydrolase [Cohnella sp. YIM B05605]
MTVGKTENAIPIKASTVRSKDGTVIGYKSMGNGPGVIILPGLLSRSDDFAQFAQEMADTFTVHVIDRRGRGQSGPQGSEYSIRKECEDLTAVQEETGADYLFGHSYGGLVALETARMNDRFTKIALYEPGVSVNHSIPITWLPPFEAALNEEDTLKAFAIFVRATAPVKSARYAPLWYLKFFLRMMRSHWGDKASLLREMASEYKEIGRHDSGYANYGSIGASTLLMRGGKSKEAVATIEALERTLPHHATLVLPKFGHMAPLNGHKPSGVVQQVKRYFLN